jgi:pimeloyl-ACP methyl ester carboxylesterase
MTYRDLVAACAHANVEGDGGNIPNLDLVVRRLTFTSEASCSATPTPSDWEVEGSNDAPDAHIVENRSWHYDVVLPSSCSRAESAVLLLHGLNERSWDKYLPWATELARSTGRAIVLFPLAFHMQRAPVSWAHPRSMSAVLRRRMARHPDLAHASVANAALSARIEHAPDRFVRSGMQTIDDVLRLMFQIRSGGHPLIASDARIDIFGYSIGAFVGQLLLLADPGGSFSDSRLLLFCGGPTCDRMRLASRYILDSAADAALRHLLLERLDEHPDLTGCIDAHPVGEAFRVMLDASRHRTRREDGFRRLAPRLSAIALMTDTVAPADAIRLTLKGEDGDLPHPVHILDLPCPSSHVAPFSENPHHTAEATRAFRTVFDIAAAHLTDA